MKRRLTLVTTEETIPSDPDEDQPPLDGTVTMRDWIQH